MTIQTFIEKAIEGGWEMPTRVKNSHEFIVHQFGKAPEKYSILEGVDVFLDPEAWKAVSKVEGNKVCICGTHGPLHTQQCPCAALKSHATYQMHRMIDALAEGKTIEQFIETL